MTPKLVLLPMTLPLTSMFLDWASYLTCLLDSQYLFTLNVAQLNSWFLLPPQSSKTYPSVSSISENDTNVHQVTDPWFLIFFLSPTFTPLGSPTGFSSTIYLQDKCISTFLLPLSSKALYIPPILLCWTLEWSFSFTPAFLKSMIHTKPWVNFQIIDEIMQLFYLCVFNSFP